LGVTRAQFKFLQEVGTGRYAFSTILNKIRNIKQKDMDTYRGILKLIKEFEDKYNIDDRMEAFKANSSVYSFIEALEEKRKRDEGRTPYFTLNFFALLYEYDI